MCALVYALLINTRCAGLRVSAKDLEGLCVLHSALVAENAQVTSSHMADINVFAVDPSDPPRFETSDQSELKKVYEGGRATEIQS